VLPWLAALGCWVLFTVTAASSSTRWRALAFGLIWAALLSSLLGLLQYFDATEWLEPLVNTSPTGEVFGNLRQRNQFASLMNMGLLALLALLVMRGATNKAWLSASAVAVVVLLAVGNALAVSRTGFVQLLMVLGLAWVWGWGHSARVGAELARCVRWVLLAAVLAYAMVSVGLALSDGERSVWGRLADGAPSCSSRITLWSNVLHLIAQKPWLGWGWGNLDYAHLVSLYDGERFCDILDNAHNLPLHLAVELGLPVAVLFCAGLAWWVWRSKPWVEVQPLRQFAWGVLALIGLHSLLEYPLWYGPFFMTALLCVWLLWAVPRETERADDADEQRVMGEMLRTAASSENLMQKGQLALINTAQTAIKFIAFIVLTATAYAAWDYHRISQIYLQPEERSPAYAENTLEKIQGSWLFAPQVDFARLMLTPITKDNAAAMRELAQATLHYSPEARVVEKRIEAASLLGLEDEVLYFALRFKRAYPAEYAAWVEKNAALAQRLGAGVTPRQ
jgi:O-antigen ligase